MKVWLFLSAPKKKAPMKKIAEIIENYSKSLLIIENSNLEEETNLKASIKLSKDCLCQLRYHLREFKFPTKEVEINFFKYQKPQIYGNLKFLVSKLIFLSEKPNGNINEQRSYINVILKKMEDRKKRNIEFFKYYKHNENSLDDKYFIRGNSQLELYSNTMHLDNDPEFSTSYDLKAAEIIAYDLLTSYYEQEINKLHLKENNLTIKEVKPSILNNLSWTASKTDLIELIYALHVSGALRNGSTDIKKIIDISSELFNIDLGNYYKTYAQIKDRQKDSTKFLDKLKFNLIQKLDLENRDL